MKSIIFSFLTLVTFSACFAQNELAQWRGPERNGIYPEKNLLDRWPEGGPQLLWKYDSLGLGYSSAVITSDRIFTTGTIDSISYIFSFNPKGTILWKKPLGLDWMGEWPGIYSTPIIYDNLGYVMNSLGVLYCFNSDTGEISWSKNVMKEYQGQPGISGFLDNLIADADKVYCTPGGIGKNVVALNSKTGEFIWASTGDSVVNAYCSPILIDRGGKRCFIYQTNKTIFAIDSENGKLVWKYERRGGTLPSTPLYQGGYLLSGEFNNGSVMLKVADDGKSVTEVWKTPGLQPHLGDAILLGDRVFGRGKKNKLYCVDWNTGKELYSESAKTMVTTLISAENLLYAYDMEGNFSLIKPLADKFEMVGSFQVQGGTRNHCSHPVIKDGKLYIRHDNSLFVYDISKE